MPSASWKLCSAYYNCFSNLGNCTWQARVAGECSICGSTDGTGTLCRPRKACMAQDASALIAAGTVNAGQMNRACMDVPITIHPVDAAALLNIKSTLGVTYTTWTATSPCRLFGSSVGFPGEWNAYSSALLHSVSHVGWAQSLPCISAVDGLGLKGSIHAEMSALTTLTRVSLTSNFFNYRIDSFTSSMKALPNLVDIEAPYNYLMGTVPPVGASLVVLNMAFNFLTDFPTFSCTTCGGNNNCLTTPSKCPSGGTIQRAAAECVYCGTNGVPPLCWGAGGVCTVDASVPIAAGTGSKALTTPLARTCVGGDVVLVKESAGRQEAVGHGTGHNGCGRAAHVAIGGVCGGSGGAAALPAEGGGRGGAVGPASTPQGPYPAPTCSPMLTLKSLLGVTFTSWAASVPCKIAGQSTTVTTWSGVLCDNIGSVLSIFPLSLADHRVCPLLIAPPTPLSLLSSLASGVASNCLTGTVPALSSGLRTLDVRYNFLTDVPAVTYTYCGGNNNCLLTPSKCATAGSTQRPTADCAICGTTNAVGPFCTASGGVYMPDAAANVAAGTVNAPVLPLLFMGCTGGTNYMYPSDAAALLNIKSAMGLTFTSWATTTPCLAEGTSPNWDEWERVTCTPFGRLYSIAYYNCFSSPGNCAWQARVAGQCSICGSTDGTGTLCGPGKACLPQDASALIAAGTVNAGQSNLACVDVPISIHPIDAAALLNIKSTLGVAYTTWTATSPCRLFGSSVGFSGEWNGVWCNGDGKAVLFAVDGLGLKGSLHADMSALTALTRVSLTSNFFNYRIDSFTSSMKDLPNLVDIRMHINYLYGEIPSFLVNIPKITQLEAPYNYLMGTVPPVRAEGCGGSVSIAAPTACPRCAGGQEECARWTLSVPTAAGTGSKSLTTPLARTCVGGAVVGIKESAAMLALKSSLGVTFTSWAASVPCMLNYLFGTVPALATGLLTLDARFNYLTDLPTAAYKSCSGNNNFLVTPSKCNAAGTVQRTAAECSFCGTTNGVGPFCTATGGACMVNAYDNVDGGIVNSATQPAVPLFCLFPPVAMKDSAAMLAIKSSLGVTYTTWAASVPCKLPGQIARVAIWTGVSCDSTGSVVGIGLENANLKGSLAMEISTLSALTYLSLSANLLNYRIDSFTTYLRFLPVLADIGAMNNYLMGSIPALASGLRTLDIRYNFIADLPAVTYSSYNGTGNCLIAPSKCGSSGINQRPPAECAFCSSTNAMGPYCWGGGGVCTVDAFVYVFGSYVNAGSTPGLATCVGGTVVAIQESAAMLALKSSLGITTNTWAASVACTLKGTTAPVPTWAGVLYDSSGNVVSMNLNSQLFQAPLTDFTSNLLKLTGLKELYLQYNWFFGSVPTALLRLPSLCVLGLGFNYLTGSFPGSATLVTLDIRSNFFYTMAPMTLKWCDGSNNCLASPAPCASGGSTQRAAADCAICASVGAVPPFCRGTGTCSPDSGPAAALGTPNSATAPMLPMVCSGIPIDPADALVLLTLKSTLSVMLSNWNAASLCTLEGQTLLPAQWGGVRCTAAGKVTSMDLGYNLFQGRLDLFAAPLKPLTTLKALFFHYNYFAGSIPSAIATLPQLTSLGLFSNYLTGTVPIPSKALVALDVGFNFLSGTFPKLPLMFCAGDNNCFLNSTACRTYGIVQRPAGACAICGTVAGQGDLCFGGSCAPLASAAVTASTVNSPNQPILPMACAGRYNPAAPMDTGSALALLNVKSALGVTFTSWLAASPCAIANSTIAVAGTWTGVLCSSAGDVLSVALTYLSVPLSFYLSSPPLPHCLIRCPLRSISMSLLACFLPAFPPHMRAATEQASSTSTLPFLPTPAPAPCTLSPVHPLSDLSNNFLRGSLDKFVTFSGLKTLLQLRLNNNWFVGSLPQTLMSFSALSLLDVHANALTGSFPAVSSVLRALYLHDNFLAGSFTTSSLTACDPSLNCFLNAVACGATSTTQRAAAACAICDSPAAQGQLCWGGTCMPKVSPTTAHPDGLAPPAMYCAGAPVVNIGPIDAQALGALKNVMGVTFTTSDPATYCTVAPTAIVPGTWDGVLCDSAGKVVSLSVRLLYPCCALLLSMHWLASSRALCRSPSPPSRRSLPCEPSPLCPLHFIFLHAPCNPKPEILCPSPHSLPSLPLPSSLSPLFRSPHYLSSLPLSSFSLLSAPLLILSPLLAAPPPSDLTSNLFDLAYNWLSSSVPAYMLTLPSLTELTIGYNYLTGALPPVTPPLSVVDVQFNFLAGTFPMLTLTLCAARMNCFLDATKCKNPNRASELPRAAASCAICNTTNAQGRLCNGGVCTVNATDLVALGAPNSAASPSLPLICVGAAFVAMDAVHAGAMLNIKASLGVTFTDWKAGSPCSLPGGVAAGSWSGVTCDGTGKVDLQSNLLQGRLDSFTASIKTPLVLKEIVLQFNYLSGQFPTALLALTTLSKLSVGYNYLTGPFPTVPASAKSLDVQGNFLSGAFPTNALTYCAATTNCLTDANNCASLGITQRSATDCAICGTAFGQGTLCGGVPCLVNTTGVTAPPTATSPPCNLYCTPVALDTNTTTTLLALKTVLGVTATEWSATTVALKPKALKSSSVPLATMVGACTVEGQTPAPGSWTGVFCNSAGAIVALLLPNQKLTGSLSTDIAKLTALTALCDSLSMPIHPCTLTRPSTRGQTCRHFTHAAAALQWGTGLQLSPSALNSRFCKKPLNRNYLTGVVPAMGAAVKVLNMAGNFLSASFPTTGVTACDARSNCFTDASKCANTLGTAQRATADCNVCGSTGAAGPLCGGGFCIPNAAAPAAAGTPNIEGQALLTMSCVGGPIEVNMRGAMLNLKASLGVTLTDWAAASPCTIAGQPSVPGAWTNVVCDTAGKVVSINAKFNYLAGPLPSALLTLPTLTSLDVSYSYLTGTVPALGTALKNLRIGGNYLSGSIGTLSGVTCSALFNCLTSQGSCTTGGTQNRVGCAICGSTNAQSTLCGGGMCVPDATAAVESNTTPTLSTPAVPMYCTGVIMDATAVTTLANIKTALGVTFTDWVAPTALLKPKAAGRTGSGSVAPTDWLTTGGYCTMDGQTPVAGSWSGVLCNSLGQPVNLNLNNQRLTGSFHADISKLSLLTVLDVSYNFFKSNLDTWAAPLKLSINLVSLELNMNALTGTFPAPISTALKRLLVDRNFMAGTFPAKSATYCTAYGNCIFSYTMCNSLYPNSPVGNCNYCGTTNGLGTACMGNPCMPVTPSPITATNRWDPMPTMRCDPVPVHASQGNPPTHRMKSSKRSLFLHSLHLPSLPPFPPFSPCCMAAAALQAMVPGLWTQPMCTLAGQAYVPGMLPLAFGNPAGMVLDMYAPFAHRPARPLLAPFSHPARPLAPCSRPSRALRAPCSPLLAPCSPCPHQPSTLLSPAVHMMCSRANGFFPTDSSKLSALTKLDLSVNLFTNRLDSFLGPFIPIKTLNYLCLHQNYFSGSFPASISALTALTELRLNLNYLTGSMPAALPASLKVIDLSSNYLVGTFPTTTATSVACASNCLQDASKCPAGSAQRAAAACAICETPDARGRMCGGGICTPNTTVAVAAGTMNTGSASLYCLGASMDSIMAMLLLHAHPPLLCLSPALSLPTNPSPLLPSLLLAAAALLNVKASLGVTFTDWALDSPCTIQGLPPLPDAWSNVVCNVSGKVMSINLRSNFLEGRLDVFAANFKALTALKEAYLDFNWFTGPIPSTLVTIATLSTFGASYNYLYGSMPAPGTALKTLTLDGNWLSGTFPGTGFSSCSATANCLASISACTTLGTVQRAAAACAVCDTADGSGTVCGGGTCAPDTAVPLASSTPNSATAAVLPRFCVGVPLDATQGNILLALKSTLGATFSDWTAATLAAPKATSTKPKKGSKRRVLLQGRGSGLLYDWKACRPSCCCPSCGCPSLCHHTLAVHRVCLSLTHLSPLSLCAPSAVACAPPAAWNSLSRDLRSQLLSGTVHSDISKLSTLTSLRLSSNLFFSRLDSYLVPITPSATLKELSVPPRLCPSVSPFSLLVPHPSLLLSSSTSSLLSPIHLSPAHWILPSSFTP
ncbi:unnamed protein product [Closterium sp. NIES-65]|nr:unnamed protein product [Closterium sp. NIES-65]